MNLRYVAFVGLVAGCAADDSAFMAPLVGTTARRDGSLVIAVAPSDHATQLPLIIGDIPPTGFRWLKLTVSPDVEPMLYTTAGYTADLSAGTAGITFAQTYTEACNPRTYDYDVCWFPESLVAGAAGVTGMVYVRASPTEVTASIDATVEGLTTQWGEPATYYKHGTISGFTVELESSASN